MAIVGSRQFQFGLLLGAAVTVLMWPHTSSAYTSEQQQACTPDAMRLCSAYIPDVDSITACMIRNKSQLSPLAGHSSDRVLRPAKLWMRWRMSAKYGINTVTNLATAEELPVAARPASDQKEGQPVQW